MKNQGFIDKNQRFAVVKSKGNAIVIVLIMIALLGALTLTLTRMGSNNNDISQEQAQVIASQVLRQAKTLEAATSNLLAKGCSITQLSFDNSLVSGYTNLQSPADKSCWLFDLAGAGLAPPIPPTGSNDGSAWFYSSNNSIMGVGPERETSAGCVSNCRELLMILPIVKDSVCKAINQNIGLTSSYGANIPVHIGTAVELYTKYAASVLSADTKNFSDPTTSGRVITTNFTTPTSSQLWDKKTACFNSQNGYQNPSGTTITGTGLNFFYQVLVER